MEAHVKIFVKPLLAALALPSTPPYNVPNGWGCGYVAGFRVPLLVVSPYTGTCSDPPSCTNATNYISGACGSSPLHSCPNFGTNNVYVHDFGSILAFTEWNFGMKNITYPDLLYADCNAPDWGSSGCPNGSTPLSDFFQLTQSRQFVPVNTYSWTYTCFTQWGSNSNCLSYGETYEPQDPDDD
jgi:hypothetical protein